MKERSEKKAIVERETHEVKRLFSPYWGLRMNQGSKLKMIASLQRLRDRLFKLSKPSPHGCFSP
jgi:hypothetical protein